MFDGIGDSVLGFPTEEQIMAKFRPIVAELMARAWDEGEIAGLSNATGAGISNPYR